MCFPGFFFFLVNFLLTSIRGGFLIQNLSSYAWGPCVSLMLMAPHIISHFIFTCVWQKCFLLLLYDSVTYALFFSLLCRVHFIIKSKDTCKWEEVVEVLEVIVQKWRKFRCRDYGKSYYLIWYEYCFRFTLYNFTFFFILCRFTAPSGLSNAETVSQSLLYRNFHPLFIWPSDSNTYKYIVDIYIFIDIFVGCSK